VVDPCRVSRCALQSAVSIAGIVLTTQAVLVEKIRSPSPLSLLFLELHLEKNGKELLKLKKEDEEILLL
jgi:chaperonin GroEL (HSP60 family)